MCDLYFDMMHASGLKSENDVQMKRIKIGKKEKSSLLLSYELFHYY